VSVGIPLTDESLEHLLRPLVDRVNRIESGIAWDDLFAVSLDRTCDTPNGRLVDAAERILLAARPKLPEELSFRVRPIREQWEARGPGLISAIGKRLAGCCDMDIDIDILLVHPFVGGAGFAVPSRSAVVVEAVLANAQPSLPEVVRLAWLWAQVAMNLTTDSQQAARKAALVLPCLAAGEYVELCRCDLLTLELALHHWHIQLPELATVAASLWESWQADGEGEDWQIRTAELLSRL